MSEIPSLKVEGPAGRWKIINPSLGPPFGGEALKSGTIKGTDNV
jgi:hypothetical protein